MFLSKSEVIMKGQQQCCLLAKMVARNLKPLMREILLGFLSSMCISFDAATVVLGAIAMFNEPMLLDILILMRVCSYQRELKYITTIILKFIFYRLIFWYIFSYLILEDEFYWLIPSLPLLAAYYVYEPLLYDSRLSFSDRFDYFFSRFPFMMGCGVIPLIFLYFNYYGNTPCVCQIGIMVLLSRSPNEEAPRYANVIPWTSRKFNTDILDIIESYF